MVEWLLSPIDPARAHNVAGMIAWHARAMVLAWAILLPLGVLTARFFKIMPGQDWPRRLDNKAWWHTHLALQYGGGVVMALGLAVILSGASATGGAGVHRWLGYAVLGIGAAQFIGGLARGSKGGPTEPSLRGDHYDMTPRRLLFERIHKSFGYVGLALAALAILTGLWLANAPVWMWLVLILWWLGLGLAFILLQRAGRAVDTYQAIWGPGAEHPGNRITPIGWGVRRRTGTAEPGE